MTHYKPINDIHADVWFIDNKLYISIHLCWDVYSGSMYDFLEDKRTLKLKLDGHIVHLREMGDPLDHDTRTNVVAYIIQIHSNPSGLAVNNYEKQRFGGGVGTKRRPPSNRKRRNTKKNQGKQWL